MDNLNLAGNKLHKTLNGLSIINKFLGNTNSTLKAVRPEIIKAKRKLKILDLGCGGGDNLRSIANWCIKNYYAVELIGIDGNKHILEYAKTKNTNQVKVNYLQANILDTSFELPDCDILISSHFMYHFSDNELIHFLKKAKQQVTEKIIFSELERNRLAYILFKVGAIFLPFSKMVKQDGLKAIKRSFSKKELVSILKQSDLKNHEIKWKWAFRLIVSVTIN